MTSRRSSRMLVALAALAVSSSSFGVETYRELLESMNRAGSPRAAAQAALRFGRELDDTEVVESAQAALGSKTEQASAKHATLRGLVETRAVWELADVGLDPKLREAIAADKRETNYQDANARPENFISRAAQRLANLRLDGPSSPNRIDAPWLIYLMWGILAAALAWFVYFVLSQVRWRMAQRRRAAILNEDEPDATVDEWLERANTLAQQGRHREAVRCLYLACLMRIDEAGVARFIRGETNWEHLRRIESAAKRPEGLDFRAPTQVFDRVWYGYRVHGMADVDYFREVYTDLTALLTPGGLR